MPRYQIDQQQRFHLSAIYVLYELIHRESCLSISLPCRPQPARGIIRTMRRRRLIDVHETGGRFIPTNAGRSLLQEFLDRYGVSAAFLEHLRLVHRNTKRSAYEHYLEVDDDGWARLIEQDTWIDMRVAVCEFKGINPIEVLFMSRAYDGLNDIDTMPWQHHLGNQRMFNEIAAIANKGPFLKDLGPEWVEAIIRKGSELGLKLIREDEELREDEEEFGYDDEEEDEEDGYSCDCQNATDDDDEEEDECDVVESNPHLTPIIVEPYPEAHFKQYLDNPRYISPIWRESWHFPL